MSDEKIADLLKWRENVPEGRLMNPGLAPFDLLGASEWSVTSSAPGRLELLCHLPEFALNPAGQLFGGFTAAYVDIASLFVAQSDVEGTPGFQSTINMRLDYFEAIELKKIDRQSICHFNSKSSFVTCERHHGNCANL